MPQSWDEDKQYQIKESDSFKGISFICHVVALYVCVNILVSSNRPLVQQLFVFTLLKTQGILFGFWQKLRIRQYSFFSPKLVILLFFTSSWRTARGKQAKSPEPEGGAEGGLWLQNHKNVTYLPGGLEHNLMSCGDAESY